MKLKSWVGKRFSLTQIKNCHWQKNTQNSRFKKKAIKYIWAKKKWRQKRFAKKKSVFVSKATFLISNPEKPWDEKIETEAALRDVQMCWLSCSSQILFISNSTCEIECDLKISRRGHKTTQNRYQRKKHSPKQIKNSTKI